MNSLIQTSKIIITFLLTVVFIVLCIISSASENDMFSLSFSEHSNQNDLQTKHMISTIGAKGAVMYKKVTIEARDGQKFRSMGFNYVVPNPYPSPSYMHESHPAKNLNNYNLGLAAGFDDTEKKNPETYIRVWLPQLICILAITVVWLLDVIRLIQNRRIPN